MRISALIIFTPFGRRPEGENLYGPTSPGEGHTYLVKGNLRHSTLFFYIYLLCDTHSFASKTRACIKNMTTNSTLKNIIAVYASQAVEDRMDQKCRKR